jgi:hypothetical protein
MFVKYIKAFTLIGVISAPALAMEDRESVPQAIVPLEASISPIFEPRGYTPVEIPRWPRAAQQQVTPQATLMQNMHTAAGNAVAGSARVIASVGFVVSQGAVLLKEAIIGSDKNKEEAERVKRAEMLKDMQALDEKLFSLGEAFKKWEHLITTITEKNAPEDNLALKHLVHNGTMALKMLSPDAPEYMAISLKDMPDEDVMPSEYVREVREKMRSFNSFVTHLRDNQLKGFIEKSTRTYIQGALPKQAYDAWVQEVFPERLSRFSTTLALKNVIGIMEETLQEGIENAQAFAPKAVQ